MDEPKGRARRAKRRLVQAGDGWTVVVAGSGSTKSSERDAARPTGARNDDNDNNHDLTVAKLAGELAGMQARWKTTPCATWLASVLGARRWSVRQAVCIGVGSPSRPWDHRLRSMWQLVLFMAVVGMLQPPGTPRLRLYAQDPAFVALDIAFLAALDVAVLPGAIESYITPASFVFAPFVDWHLLLPVFLKGKDPQLYAGNDILRDYRLFATTRDRERVLDECADVGSAFVLRRERRKLPEFAAHATALEGLALYWREDEDG